MGLELLIKAIVWGATAGLKSISASAVKDAYIALKTYLLQQHPTVEIGVKVVEDDPNSENGHSVLRDKLNQAAVVVDNDEQLLQLINQVIQIVSTHHPDLQETTGLYLEDFEAQNLRASGIKSTGTGVKAKNVRIQEDAIFEDITAREDTQDEKKV